MICAGDDVGKWVAERVGFIWTEHQSAIGWKSGEAIKAGCVFESYIPNKSVVVHLAVERASKEFILTCFRYGFLQLNINCAIAVVDSGNQKAINWNEKIGFKRCGLIPDAGRNGDLIIMNFNRDSYLDIEARYGK